MKANSSTRQSTERPARRVRATAAAGIVGLFALSACTSDPGPRRVAEDIIKTEVLANDNLNEECLLDALDDFSNDELESISSKLGSGAAETQNEGSDELAAFQAALEACG